MGISRGLEGSNRKADFLKKHNKNPHTATPESTAGYPSKHGSSSGIIDPIVKDKKMNIILAKSKLLQD